MLWQAIVTNCLAALLLAPSFAQVQHPLPAQRPDGQWHHFQKNGGPNPSRPNAARPPQNQPGHAGNWLRRYKDLPPAQQRRALENDPQFRRLPPQRQAELQRRLQRFFQLASAAARARAQSHGNLGAPDAKPEAAGAPTLSGIKAAAPRPSPGRQWRDSQHAWLVARTAREPNQLGSV